MKFADDTTRLAASQNEILTLLNIIEKTSAAYCLNINYSKTKITIVNKERHNCLGTIAIDPCKVVKEFVYLGPLIDNSFY